MLIAMTKVINYQNLPDAALAILMIIFIFWCENYYRRASRVSIRRLLRAVAMMTGGQVVLLGIVYVMMRI